MELDFPSSLILLSFLFFMFKVLKTWKMSNSNKNLPPGPWKLPLIGNLHQLVGAPPHHALRHLATKYGPLMYVQLGEVPTLFVSSPEYAKEIMKTHDLAFCSRPQMNAAKVMSYNFTDIVFSPYGEYWRQLRKICTMELLSMKRVQSMRSIREQETSNVVEWIRSNEGSTINLTQKIFSTTYMVISKAAFKRDYGDLQQKLISLLKEIGHLASGFDVSAVFPSMTFLSLISRTDAKILKIHHQVDEILGYVINEQLKHRATSMTSERDEDQDLVTVLLKFLERDDLDVSLTIENIKAILLDIFSGGSDTSSMTVDWSMVEMMRNPRVMEKAQAEVRQVFDRRGRVDEAGIVELKYLKLVIKETLRLHPPAPFLVPRENAERCEIKGYEIPSKTKVMVNVWAIGRDPKYWTEPESYYPERFLSNPIDFKGANFEYIPFGAGRRMCPGMLFGMANVELLLSQLLYHFDWKLPNKMKAEDVSMVEDFGITIRRKEDFYVIPTPYRPSPSH